MGRSDGKAQVKSDGGITTAQMEFPFIGKIIVINAETDLQNSLGMQVLVSYFVVASKLKDLAWLSGRNQRKG